MRDIYNMWGNKIDTVLETEDIEVGKEYRGHRNIKPQYLCHRRLIADKFHGKGM